MREATTVDADALRTARAEGRAVVAFTIHDLAQGLGAVQAAEEEGAPVILQLGSGSLRQARRAPLVRLAQGLRETARVPVGIHLDHARGLEEIAACLALGCTSVMFDGSALPFEENVASTREVIRRAHAVGAWVEGELSGIPGDEDASTACRAEAVTDPDDAARFVAETGVDALAVAVGNVHGLASGPVALDLELLARIGEAVPVPLVLHGASGLPDDVVRRAIALGVAKVNVNAELRRAFRAAILTVAQDPPSDDALAALTERATAATRRVARAKLCALAGRCDR